MKSIEVKDLDNLVATLRLEVGDQLIDALERKADRRNEIDLVLRSNHPHAMDWEIFISDLKRSLKSQQLQFSERTFYILDLLARIHVVSNLHGADAVKARFSTDHGAAHEITTASRISQNFKTRFITDQSQPDIEVNLGNKSLFIECKSLPDHVLIEQSRIDEINFQSISYMRKSNKPGIVRVRLNRVTLPQDIKQVKATLKHWSGKGSENYDENGLVIEITPTNRGWSPVPLSIERSHYGTCLAYADIKKDNGTGLYANLVVCEVNPCIEPVEIKRVIKNVKKAAKQIGNVGKGIIVLELPSRDYKNFEDSVDQVYDAVMRELGKYNHVFYALLVGKSLTSQPRDGQNLVADLLSVVPNMNSNPQPAEFDLRKLWGIQDQHGFGDKMERGAGKGISELGMKFELFKAMDELPGISNLQGISADGRYQLRMIQTHHGNHRLEVISPQLGRIVLDTKISLDIGDHDFYVMWSSKGVVWKIDDKVFSKEIISSSQR